MNEAAERALRFVFTLALVGLVASVCLVLFLAALPVGAQVPSALGFAGCVGLGLLIGLAFAIAGAAR